MVVGLIIACEIGFWVLLVLGLGLRYLAKLPRVGAAVLLCEPLLEVVLLVVTAIDLRNGVEADWSHGLAAVYIGFTVAFGHYLIRWADGHAAHRFSGGPRPARPPRYGMARAVHEWKIALRTLVAGAVAGVLLQAAIWYVGSTGETASLKGWQERMGLIVAINVIIAVGYTVWPKRDPAAGAGGETGAGGRTGAGTGEGAVRERPRGWAERWPGR